MRHHLPMQKVLYFNNLFYINDLYMYMCLLRDKLGTKIGVKMQKRTSIDIEIGSSVLFDSTDFFCKVKNL